MKTAITEMFDIERPILQGGMHYVGYAELAAAVSNAGGLGTITGLTQRTPKDLANEIARCRDMTDKPFAVNLTFLPAMNQPDYPGYVKAIIEGGQTARFWKLGAVLFLTVFVIVGLISNFERLLSAKGLERETIAGLAAIMGVSVIVGRLMVGVLVDKFWAPAVACVFFSVPIIAMLILLNLPVTFTVGVIIAVAIGLASGAELDLLAYLTGKYFGPRNYAEIFGGIFAIFAVGAGIAPPIFGMLAAQTGGYDVPLYLGIALLCMSIPLFLSLGRYPDEALAEA